MSAPVVVAVLTALAAVVVVLTHVRMSGEAAGRTAVPRGLVRVHTVAGGLAVVVWTVFLAAGDALGEGGSTVVGIVALLLWWVTAIAGVLVLLRWLPARGRHAGAPVTDGWSEGPGLSLLGHVGMVAGVAVFTWSYLVGAV
ncbi:MAG: hypothetical protein CMH83_14135 [Nocardioides sp.]|nr:hypothetical protein [Nocardioides sp.]